MRRVLRMAEYTANFLKSVESSSAFGIWKCCEFGDDLRVKGEEFCAREVEQFAD